jgi:hypothetical protein
MTWAAAPSGVPVPGKKVADGPEEAEVALKEEATVAGAVRKGVGAERCCCRRRAAAGAGSTSAEVGRDRS